MNHRWERIDAVIRLLGKDLGPAVTVAIMWESIVGEPLASHTAPVRLSHAVLFVGCEGAAWAQELSHRREEILTEIRSLHGLEDIREIKTLSRPGDIGPPRTGKSGSPR